MLIEVIEDFDHLVEVRAVKRLISARVTKMQDLGTVTTRVRKTQGTKPGYNEQRIVKSIERPDPTGSAPGSGRMIGEKLDRARREERRVCEGGSDGS